jgi:hypothetical protein
MKSKVCGGGKGTACDVVGVSLIIAGVAGADDFGPGVTAVGDLEAITGVGKQSIRGELTLRTNRKSEKN